MTKKKYYCDYKNKELIQNRAAIFAHFDDNNVIQDYVIYYLQSLKDIAGCIIFVSDCDLPENEISKISHIADKVIAKHHGEYDFGSYKRGFQYLSEQSILENFDEIIFANDSCFGPFCNFNNIWEEMKNYNCDFWGISQHELISRHVQSFFLVFKKNVFNSKIFKNFINSVQKENTKKDIIIKYEIGLSKLLLGNGFKLGSYLNIPVKNFIMLKYLTSDKCLPLLKTSIVRDVPISVIKALLIFFQIKFKIKYPFELIFCYDKANLSHFEFKKVLKYIYKKIILLMQMM